MTHAVFAIPGDLATRTGGYGYARELIRHLPACGIGLRYCALPGSFPEPSDADVSAALGVLGATAEDEVLLIDGLAFGVLPAERIARLDRTIVALVHHPLGFETGLSEATKQTLLESERAALASADRIIVSSDTTRDVLIADFGLAPGLITIAEPGTCPLPCGGGSGREVAPIAVSGFASGDRESVEHNPAPKPSSTKADGAAPLCLLAVGSVVPRKGFDMLVEALAGMRDLDWRLRLVGSLERSATTAQALRSQIAAHALADRVDLVGELTAEPLGKEYSAADLFVHSSHYEGYGMVLAEAMAHGLPIVTATGGAASKTVPDAAALKVPPGDAAALAIALRRAVSDAALRRKLAAASRRAGSLLPRWTETAAKVAAVLHDVAQRALR